MSIQEGRMVLPPDYEPPKHWWQNPRWIASVALLLFAIGNIAWAAFTFTSRQEIEDASAAFDAMAEIAADNTETLTALGEQQSDIDKLVGFVEDAQSQGSNTDDVIRLLITLLCASEDPVRAEACIALPTEDP